MSTPEEIDYLTFEEIDPRTNKPAVIPIEVHPTKTTKAKTPLWIIQPSWLKERTWTDYKGKAGGDSEKPLFRKGQDLKEFALTVEDNPIINALRDDPFNFKITTKAKDEKQRFKDVVLAINDIENQTGIMATKDFYDLEAPKTSRDHVESFGGKEGRLKFLDLGARLFGKRKKRTKSSRATSTIQKGKIEFEADPLIDKWLTKSSNTQDRDGDFTQPLKKALYVLDMSPEKILKGASDSDDPLYDPETVFANIETFQKSAFMEWMTNVIGDGEKNKGVETWTDINGKKWNLWDWATASKGSDSEKDRRAHVTSGGNKESRKGSSIGNMVQKGSRGGSTQLRQNMMTALKHFLAFHGRVPEGKVTGTIFEKPTPILNYSALRLTAQQIDSLSNCLKNPKGDSKFAEQDQADGKIRFEQLSSYAIDEDDEAEMGEDDEDGENLEVEKLEKEKTKERRYITYETTRADWEDAYLFYRIALETGWRAFEGLTMTVSFDKPEELKQGSMTGNFGAMFDPDDPLNTAVYTTPIRHGGDELEGGMMWIKFLTRKTWNKKRFTHEEMVGIAGTDVRTMIEKRLNEIQQGIAQYDQIPDDEIFLKYGIVRLLSDGKPNYNHALIGTDGKYIEVGTYKLPTSHGLRATELKELRARGEKPKEFIETWDEDGKKVVRTLHAIIRKCIVDSKVNLNQTEVNKKTGKRVKIGQYWVTNTMHSLRHVFAQYWLFKSDFNFSFVAQKGHWAGTKILEEAYGGTSEQEIIDQNFKFQAVNLHDVEATRATTTDQAMIDAIKKAKEAKGNKSL